MSAPYSSLLGRAVDSVDDGVCEEPPVYRGSYGVKSRETLPRTRRRTCGENWKSTRPAAFGSVRVPVMS